MGGASAGEAIMDSVKQGFDQATDSFQKGWKGEAPNIQQVFEPSARTKGLWKQALGEGLGDVGKTKKELEGKRAGIIDELHVKKDEDKKKDDEELIAGVADKFGSIFKDTTRIGFPELGKKLQDYLLKAGTGELGMMQRQVAIGEMGLKKQDELIKAVQGQPIPGGLG